MTKKWTRDHLSVLSTRGFTTRRFGGVEPVIPSLYLWDLWPVRDEDGEIADVGGSELWMALAAPRELEPRERHDVARIRLLSKHGDDWRDHGDLLGERARGSRQWAGSAVFHSETGKLDVFYTAAGRSGEERPTFIQRIIGTSTQLRGTHPPTFTEWSPHVDLLEQGGLYFSTLSQHEGEPGFIKAFRDPFPFREGDHDCLLFTASMAESETDFDGAIGLARATKSGDYRLRPPLVTADGVNNELERPHLVRYDGLLYLFFSTQARTFHPDVPGPTGLYGFVSDSLEGDWQALNGSGLVLANPTEGPFQAYSWLVLNDLSVIGFVDFHSLDGRTPEEVAESGQERSYFGGTPTPFERLTLSGATSRIVSEIKGAGAP